MSLGLWFYDYEWFGYECYYHTLILSTSIDPVLAEGVRDTERLKVWGVSLTVQSSEHSHVGNCSTTVRNSVEVRSSVRGLSNWNPFPPLTQWRHSCITLSYCFPRIYQSDYVLTSFFSLSYKVLWKQKCLLEQLCEGIYWFIQRNET